MYINVEWETDGEDVELPKVVYVPKNLDSEDVCEYLSDVYGWLVNDWSIHVTK